MAKQPTPLDDPFAKTSPDSEQDPELAAIDLDKKPTVNSGLGIRTGEMNAVKLLAKRHKVSVNAFIKFCIRYVITQVRDGKLDPAEYLEIPPEPQRKFNYPK